MRQRVVWCGVVLLLLSGVMARGQEAADGNKYVSREEYEKILKEMSQMRTEMAVMKKTQAETAKAAPSQADVDQALDDVDKRVKQMRAEIDAVRPGVNRIFIGGDAETGFTAKHGEKSTFDAGVAPLFLWQISDRILFEAAMDIGISTDDTASSSTTVDLTIANFTYLVNEYITAGGGLFVVPFGVFHNHYDPPWINKLPDTPLPFGDNAIAPGSEVGFFVEGVIPVDSMKFNYAVYVTNGPNLITTGTSAGSLNFDDFTDLNNNKAVGGRLGFQPLPELEMGYSIMGAQVDPPNFQTVNALIQAVDIEYKKEIDWLMGTIDLRAEWVFSNVGEATYNPTGTPGGAIRFDNDRNGGYVQASYRPTRAGNKCLRNLEPVFRYDRLEASSGAPGGGTEQRWTLGLDYWFAPNVVLKVAYQFDDVKDGEGNDAFMMQMGFGL